MIQIILVVVIFILLLTLGTYFVVKRKVSLNDIAKRMVKINMIYFPENDMVNSEQWMEYLTEKGNTEKERHEKELFILVLTNAITNKLSSLETIRKMYYSGLKYERSNIRRIFGIGNRNISNNTSINTISPTNSLYIPHTHAPNPLPSHTHDHNHDFVHTHVPHTHTHEPSHTHQGKINTPPPPSNPNNQTM